MASLRLYKFLNDDGNSPIQGQPWHLPEDDRPGKGKWMPPIKGKLIPCQNGYHALRPQDLVSWLGPVLYELEYSGCMVLSDDKVVVRRARLLRHIPSWNSETQRLFAADCAEHVLPIFERAHPSDDRPRLSIKAARDFANGKIDSEQMRAAWDAAWDAARDAARAAAGDAAGDAAWAAGGDAAWDAAWDAARAAAGDAGGAAAGDAEKKWQAGKLLSYLKLDEAANG